jgi:hypothetical protein
LGWACCEAGHSRVPAPPHITTGWIRLSVTIVSRRSAKRHPNAARAVGILSAAVYPESFRRDRGSRKVYSENAENCLQINALNNGVFYCHFLTFLRIRTPFLFALC